MLRDATCNDHVILNSIADLHEPQEIITIVHTRCFRMPATEAIVFYSCLYLALIHGVFYLTFEAWPFAFVGIYHMSNTVYSLTHPPFGIGTVVSVHIFFQYDKYLLTAQTRGAECSFKLEYRWLPLACIGGSLWTASLFLVGLVNKRRHTLDRTLSTWCLLRSRLPARLHSNAELPRRRIHNMLCTEHIQYDSKHLWCAATASCATSVRTAWLHRACSPLDFISTVMIPVPFLFLRWGHVVRSKSKSRHKLQILRGEKREIDTTAGSPASAFSVEDGSTAAAEVILVPDQQFSALLSISGLQRRRSSIPGLIDVESGLVTSSGPL